MLSGKNKTLENFGGTEEFREKDVIREMRGYPDILNSHGFREKWGIRKVGGTKESQKNMLSKKFGGIRTFGISMQGKTGHSKIWRVTRSPRKTCYPRNSGVPGHSEFYVFREKQDAPSKNPPFVPESWSSNKIIIN